MPPDRSKIRIGISYLEDYLARNVAQSLVMALDLETTGFQLFKSDITWISWCAGEEYGAIPLRHRNYTTFKRRLLGLCRCVQGSRGSKLPHRARVLCQNDDEAKVKAVIRKLHYEVVHKHRLLWHNAGFDLSMLVASGWLEMDKIEAEIFDTMLASYNLNPIKVREHGRGTHGLKYLHDTILRESGDERQPEFEQICNGRPFQDVTFDEAAYYAVFDSWSTYHLYRHFEAKIASNKRIALSLITKFDGVYSVL